MTTMKNRIGLAAALLVATANVAFAQDGTDDQAVKLDVETEGFVPLCEDYIRNKFCADGPHEAAEPAAPVIDPKVATLETQVAELMRLNAEAAAAKAKKRTAKKGQSLNEQYAALALRVLELEATPPSDPGESYQVRREELDELKTQLAELGRKLEAESAARKQVDEGQGDNNMAQSKRLDGHDRQLLALHKTVVRELERLDAHARPIEFAMYAAPLLLTSGDGTDISYFGIAPQLLIPIWGRTSLELEAGLLIGDDKNPFGTFSRVGVGYRAGNRVHIVGGIGLLMAGIDDRLEAASASVLGTAGLRFGLGDIRFLDAGFDIMLGNELDVDGEQDLMMGARFLVGFRLPD